MRKGNREREPVSIPKAVVTRLINMDLKFDKFIDIKGHLMYIQERLIVLARRGVAKMRHNHIRHPMENLANNRRQNNPRRPAQGRNALPGIGYNEFVRYKNNKRVTNNKYAPSKK